MGRDTFEIGMLNIYDFNILHYMKVLLSRPKNGTASLLNSLAKRLKKTEAVPKMGRDTLVMGHLTTSYPTYYPPRLPICPIFTGTPNILIYNLLNVFLHICPIPSHTSYIFISNTLQAFSLNRVSRSKNGTASLFSTNSMTNQRNSTSIL